MRDGEPVPLPTWLAYAFPSVGGVLYRLLQPGVSVLKQERGGWHWLLPAGDAGGWGHARRPDASPPANLFVGMLAPCEDETFLFDGIDTGLEALSPAPRPQFLDRICGLHPQ
jgi:hypothetical protein